MEMVERHYFRGKVIRDYSFKFGFVIPNSTNSWEFVYDLPNLTEEEKAEISAAPWEVKSDSFFFAEGKHGLPCSIELCIHHLPGLAAALHWDLMEPPGKINK